MTGPLYDAVMALHVLAAVVGFGALGATGTYAAAVRRSPDPLGVEALRRYFRPGRNWASRAVLAVPLLGGALLALGHGQDVGRVWPWVGLCLWTATAAVASSVIWPAERLVQRGFAAAADREAAAAVRSAARRAELGGSATSLLFVAALVVMVWQPR